MKKTAIRLLALCLLSSFAVHAQVYKYKENGVTKYSDTPPPNAASAQTIETKNPAPTPVAGAANADNAESAAAKKEMDAKKRSIDAEADKEKAKNEAEKKREKQQNCKSAKANMANYQQGGRIYKMNEKGEREFMDDKAINDGYEQAKRDVAKYCS